MERTKERRNFTNKVFAFLIVAVFSWQAGAAEPAEKAEEKTSENTLEKKVEQNSKFIDKLSKSKYLKFGAEFHGNLNLNLTDDDNDITEAGFEATRMYLTLKSTITDWLDTRTTLDFGRYEVDDKEPLLGYIKYAYFDVKPVSGLKLRFGQQGSAWIGTIDKALGMRYVTKSAADYFKYQSSAELGFSVLGEYFDGILGFQASIFNGSGYKEPAPAEGPGELLYEGRVSVTPMASSDSFMKGLALHGIFLTDAEGAGDDAVRMMQYGAALTFNSKYVDMAFEALMRSLDTDGYDSELLLAPSLALKYMGFSLFGGYGMAKNPNAPDDNETWSHLVAGVAYKPIKMFAVSLNYQDEKSKKWEDSESQQIMLSTLFKF